MGLPLKIAGLMVMRSNNFVSLIIRLFVPVSIYVLGDESSPIIPPITIADIRL
jgi:hypothetical protein